MNGIEFHTQMASKFIVVIRDTGCAQEDYFGADDYAAARAAYDLAARRSGRKVALLGRTRMPGSPVATLTQLLAN